jgi:hypothetical protein
MLLTFLSWIYFFLIFTLCGLLFGKAMNPKRDNAPGLLHSFFYGFFFVTLVLCALSFVMRISYEAHIIMIAISAYSYFRNRKSFHEQLGFQFNDILQSETKYKIFIAVLTLVFLERSSAYFAVYDTNLYHLQTIKWIENYHVIKGLGNLHGRLAFNNLGFLTYAFGDFSFINGIFLHGINGLIYFLLMMKLLQQWRGGRTGAGFFILLGVQLSLIFTFKFISSFSHDILVLQLIVYIFYLYFEEEEKDHQLIILLSVLVVTCKISSLFILGVPLILLFRKEISLTGSRNAILASALILAFFAGRNIILSGYLVYPFPGIDIMNVDWKMPQRQAMEEAAAVKAWAIDPAMDPAEARSLTMKAWIPLWFRAMEPWNKILVIMLGISIAFNSYFIWVKKEFKSIRLIFLLILMALTFWFIKAPDMRFAFGFIFCMISLVLYFFFPQPQANGLLRSFVLAFSAFTAIIYIVYLVKNKNNDISFAEKIIAPAGYMKFPVHSEEINGNTFYITEDAGGRCGYEALPSLPKFNKDIYYRGDKIEDGFRQISK